MRKLTIAFIPIFMLVSFWGTEMLGQESDSSLVKRNSVYAEFLGSSLAYYNVGYERLVMVRGKDKIAVTLGAQYLPSDTYSETDVFSVSPQVSYL